MDVVESPSLEVLKTWLDMALRDRAWAGVLNNNPVIPILEAPVQDWWGNNHYFVCWYIFNVP